jgi:hypothetical protein
VEEDEEEVLRSGVVRGAVVRAGVVGWCEIR